MKSVLWRVAKRLFYIQDARCLKVKKAQGPTYLYSFPSTNRNVNFQTLIQKYNMHHKTDVPPCSFLVLLFYPVLDSLSQGLFSLLWPQTYEMLAKCFGRVSMINRSINLLPNTLETTIKKLSTDLQVTVSSFTLVQTPH